MATAGERVGADRVRLEEDRREPASTRCLADPGRHRLVEPVGEQFAADDQRRQEAQHVAIGSGS